MGGASAAKHNLSHDGLSAMPPPGRPDGGAKREFQDTASESPHKRQKGPLHRHTSTCGKTYTISKSIRKANAGVTYIIVQVSWYEEVDGHVWLWVAQIQQIPLPREYDEAAIEAMVKIGKQLADAWDNGERDRKQLTAMRNEQLQQLAAQDPRLATCVTEIAEVKAKARIAAEERAKKPSSDIWAVDAAGVVHKPEESSGSD